MLEATLRIADAVPTLRIVLDHLPSLDPGAEEQARSDAHCASFAVGVRCS